ncbi:hypothetical protein E4T43_01656 [Aureobasidium subglaciale]|nr:hypothetical protein E4T43_01656 [Aureobasidium subglaciale]
MHLLDLTMRETRLRAKKRAAGRNQVIENVKSHHIIFSAVELTTKSNTTKLDEEFVPTGVFRLFDLPTELQNMIYTYAVTDPEDVIMLDNARTPPLVRVNRYLRNNVLPIFLGVNTFRLWTEEVPTIINGRTKEAKFKIHSSVLEWLSPLNYDTPLFKNLIVHFGVDAEIELSIQCMRKKGGFTVNHELICIYCTKLSNMYPVLPHTFLKDLPASSGLHRLIDQAEQRDATMKREHDAAVRDLEAAIFGELGGLKKDALAISMANIDGIERVYNDSHITLAMMTHGVNMKRLRAAPVVVVLADEKKYLLRRDSAT